MREPMPANTHPYSVRALQRKDITELLRLQKKAGGLYAPWTSGQLESHLRVFREGQLVVVDARGAIAGVGSTLRLAVPAGHVPGDWMAATGMGYFHTHTRDGNTLYLADLIIDPEADRSAVHLALDAALVALGRELGIERVLTACRLSGFAPYADTLSPEAYVRRVAEGKLTEPVVSPLMARGFRPVALVPDLQNAPRTQLVTLLEWRSHAA